MRPVWLDDYAPAAVYQLQTGKEMQLVSCELGESFIARDQRWR